MESLSILWRINGLHRRWQNQGSITHYHVALLNEKASRLDTDNPVHSWWIWPFIGQIESRDRILRSIAFPFWWEEHTAAGALLDISSRTIGTRNGQWNRIELYPSGVFINRRVCPPALPCGPSGSGNHKRPGKTREVRRLFLLAIH